MSAEVTKEYALEVASAIGGNAEHVIRDLLRQLEPVPAGELARRVAGSIAVGKGFMISNETRMAVMRALHEQAIPAPPPQPGLMAAAAKLDPGDTGKNDELYSKAVDLVRQFKRGSISMVQRHLRIGYNRSAIMLEAMEKEGIITPWGPGGSGRDYVPDFERKKPDDTEGGAL